MMFTDSNQWLLVGLPSYAAGCARPNFPGVYTRVTAYQEWIRTKTSGMLTNPDSSTPFVATNTLTTTASTLTTATTSDGSSWWQDLIFVALKLFICYGFYCTTVFYSLVN